MNISVRGSNIVENGSEEVGLDERFRGPSWEGMLEDCDAVGKYAKAMVISLNWEFFTREFVDGPGQSGGRQRRKRECWSRSAGGGVCEEGCGGAGDGCPAVGLECLGAVVAHSDGVTLVLMFFWGLEQKELFRDWADAAWSFIYE
jgi:hypothetical protein